MDRNLSSGNKKNRYSSMCKGKKLHKGCGYVQRREELQSGWNMGCVVRINREKKSDRLERILNAIQGSLDFILREIANYWRNLTKGVIRSEFPLRKKIFSGLKKDEQSRRLYMCLCPCHLYLCVLSCPFLILSLVLSWTCGTDWCWPVTFYLHIPLSLCFQSLQLPLITAVERK